MALATPWVASAQEGGTAAAPAGGAAGGSGGAAGGSGGAAAAATGGDSGGYSGGDFVISDNNPALWGGVRRRKAVPEHHVVKQGDTLWQICETYYADPWAWPQLWAYNKSITNPHWIYPGDRIRLLGGAAGGAEKGGGERIRLTGTRSVGGGPVTLKQNAFIDPKEMEGAGSIVGANEEKLLLSHRDEIYIKEGDKLQPQPGKSYAVYRVAREMENSDGDTVGYLVEVKGTARVKRAPKGKVATAQITESVGVTERGDKIGPLRRRFKRLPVAKASRNVEGRVVDALADKVLHAIDDIVFVDLGTSHGVRNGNRLLVVRTGDARKRLLQEQDDDDPKWPREVVAEISVLDAREKVSIGIISRAVKAVRLGDKAVLRQGY